MKIYCLRLFHRSKKDTTTMGEISRLLKKPGQKGIIRQLWKSQNNALREFKIQSSAKMLTPNFKTRPLPQILHALYSDMAGCRLLKTLDEVWWGMKAQNIKKRFMRNLLPTAIWTVEKGYNRKGWHKYVAEKRGKKGVYITYVSVRAKTLETSGYSQVSERSSSIS